jgi:predicted DsbA family dithiol-disulfide isomerase
MNFAVDLISDVICPWCYIGKRRLEKAIAALDDQHDVQIRWHGQRQSVFDDTLIRYIFADARECRPL